jgi:DMSO/TMAO reductase YedYZ molybdopterin-dependent catalytic subunit
MNTVTRRRFIRLTLGGVTLYILSGCAPGEEPQAAVTDTPAPGPISTATEAASSTPTLAATSTPKPTPTPGPTPVILRNENRPGFFIRYYKPFEAVDPDRWILAVEGLVKKPQELTLADVQSLPFVSQVSRMTCVEGWSAAAKWGGFHLSSLLELVEPLPEAKWLHFYCADDYFESLTLEELLAERVIFVYQMNDETVPDVYGAPLRLIVPPKYGYKGPKAITRLVFAEEELPGYWPTVGPYSTDGYIQPGTDYPLDIGELRKIDGGEVIYPDGPEAEE